MLNTAWKSQPLGELQRVTDVSLLPEDWRLVRVSEATRPMKFDSSRQIAASDYKAAGRWPVIDQGQARIAGYTDAESCVVDRNGPVIIFGDHTRTIKFVDFDFALGAQGTRPLLATRHFDPEFLFFALSNLQIPSRGYNRHFKVFRELSVPLPPIEEQRAIVSALGRVRDASSAHERTTASVSELKRAAMRTLFTRGLRGEPQRETEIGPIPETWDLVELEAVQESIRYGTSVRCTHRPTGLPVLRIPNIEAGRINTEDLKFCDSHTVASARCELRAGDLLFIRTNGVLERLGACAVYDGTPGGALFASYLIRSRLMSDRVVPRFVAYFFGSEIGRRAIADRVSPAADGKFNLNAAAISDLPLPLPERLEEQRGIVGILDALDRKAGFHRRKRAVLNDLFRSLLHKLMTGEVRVADLGLPEGLESVAS